MGSPCEVQLQGLSPPAAAAIAEQAVAEVERLEALYSRYREDSLLSQINRVAGAGGEIAVDFGGVVKEYAVDRVASLCLSAGGGSGVINLGGGIRVLGPRADGSAWRVGVRHPRDKDGVVSSLLIARGALASSGDYERRI